MYTTIIWATDGSEEADFALAEARHLSEMTGARLVAVHCDQRLNGRLSAWPVLPDEDDRRLKIGRQVDALQEAGVDIDLVIRHSHQEAADVVASVAAELGGDVIVCGTRGLGAFTGTFVGSVAQRLLRIAPCPVLTVRRRKTQEVEAADRERTAEPAGVGV